MAFIAPAGTPLSLRDLCAGYVAGIGGDAAVALERRLAAHSGQSRAWLMSSGRAGMTFTLRAMRAIAPPERNEVVIAGYTCYSVAASVELAGLSARLVDIDPHTLTPDVSQLRGFDLSRVLCIVSANLYGIPNALSALETAARDSGAFMLDDAAQALGAEHEDRPVGGFGDAGLYSFDKGKIITTLQGGAIVARAGKLASALDEAYESLDSASAAQTLGYAVKLGLYALLLKPSLYGVVQRLPGLGLGRTVYENDYPIARYSGFLAGLALRLQRKVESLNAVRARNALALRAVLTGVRGLAMPQELPGNRPVYCRFPIFVADPSRRERFLAACQAEGIGATASYPQALIDVPEVARVLAPAQATQDGAKAVARSIVTLPTHAYCPPDLPERVRAIAERALA
jgi:perosamine synthetase